MIMSIMIKPCIIAHCVLLLIMINLASLAKADDNNNNKGKLLGVFIFGDSEVDAGNNNYFFTLSKADKPPYGIDFKSSGGNATGRFTNGRTAADIIGEELGLPNYVVPYLSLSSDKKAILPGVNYASGGAGILNSTGKVFIDVVEMDTQVDYFNITRQQFDKLLITTPYTAKEFIMKHSLFSVSIGSNDFLGNYLVPGLSIAATVLKSPDDFIADMINQLRVQLTRLYDLDGRKFFVTNIAPIGCIPYQRKQNIQGKCVDSTNELAIKYNKKLKDLLGELRVSLPESTFLYADLYTIVMEIITNYDQFGFTSASEPCHEVENLDGIVILILCSDRSKYVFWDQYHPTEATNLLVTKQLLEGHTKYISPINLTQLVRDF